MSCHRNKRTKMSSLHSQAPVFSGMLPSLQAQSKMQTNCLVLLKTKPSRSQSGATTIKCQANWHHDLTPQQQQLEELREHPWTDQATSKMPFGSVCAQQPIFKFLTENNRGSMGPKQCDLCNCIHLFANWSTSCHSTEHSGNCTTVLFIENAFRLKRFHLALAASVDFVWCSLKHLNNVEF